MQAWREISESITPGESTDPIYTKGGNLWFRWTENNALTDSVSLVFQYRADSSESFVDLHSYPSVEADGPPIEVSLPQGEFRIKVNSTEPLIDLAIEYQL